MTAHPADPYITAETRWAVEMVRSNSTRPSPTLQERTELAEAVSGPPNRRVAVINERNQIEGWVHQSRALAEDAPFFVTVRNRFLAVDLDDLGATEQAHHLVSLLLVEGHAPVLVSSGSEDHRHVFCRVNPAEIRSLLREARITPQQLRDTIRPPLARHRFGDRGQLLLPAESDEVLVRLTGRDSQRRPLGDKARWLLAQDQLRANESVSERLLSIATGAANAGWDYEDFITVITCRRFPVSRLLEQRIERRGRSATHGWLAEHVWPAGERRVAESPAMFQGRPSDRALRLLTWAMTTPWTGRSGPSRWAVYLAMIQKQVTCGQRRFDISQRELCTLAGISGRETVRRALNALIDEELVRIVNSDAADPVRRLRDSQTWELCEPSEIEAVTPNRQFADALDILGQDAFRNAVGLGKTAEQVYTLVSCSPGITSSEASTTTGIAIRRTRQLLKIMLEKDLLFQDDEDRWVTTDRAPSSVIHDTSAVG